MGEKHIPACIDQKTLKQVRIELEYGTFRERDSPTYNFASRWLSIKESEERDNRDNESLSISRKALRNSTWANIIAISAIIIAIMAIVIPLLMRK